jgi:hypothetical protein
MADLTLTEWLGILGFGLAIISLVWQGITWFVGTRVRLKIKLFKSKETPGDLVVECVNKSHRRTVQVRQVWVQWGRDQNDGVVLAPGSWRERAPTEPGGIFQAKASSAGLRALGMPALPMKAHGVVMVGTRSRPYRSRRVLLREDHGDNTSWT